VLKQVHNEHTMLNGGAVAVGANAPISNEVRLCSLSLIDSQHNIGISHIHGK
jgi:hypothetical protein